MPNEATLYDLIFVEELELPIPDEGARGESYEYDI